MKKNYQFNISASLFVFFSHNCLLNKHCSNKKCPISQSSAMIIATNIRQFWKYFNFLLQLANLEAIVKNLFGRALDRARRK